MAAHRWWRIKPRQPTTYFSVQEVELRTSPGGSDITSPSTTISIGAFQDGVAAKCIDNNTGTYCQQSPASGAWILIDLGSGNDADAQEVAIAGSPHGTDRSPQEFDVEYSDDGSTFFVAWSCSYSDGLWTTGSTLIAFTKPSSGAARRWRLRQGTSGDGNFKVAEVIFRETSGGAQGATGGTPSARQSAGGGYSLAGAFDGNSATGYTHSSTAWAECEYIAYDLGSGVTKDFVEVLIQSVATFQNQAPTRGWIESGDDGRSWLSRIPFSGLSWTSGSSNTVPTGGGGGAWVPRIICC